ncbi:MAG: hypothetical protein ACPGSG_11645 [Prolixibacteraceae bacterium]
MINTVLKGTSSMVRPWLLHGLSTDFAFSMEEPWTNHGQTMDEPFI